MNRVRARGVVRASLGLALALLALSGATYPSGASALESRAAAVVEGPRQAAVSLESAAAKAGETGRKVAMSLIVLGFAIASIILVFRRDFKEAAGVFVIGMVAILFATPAGVNLLRDTVSSLFGSS
jgi:hypothetical protein